MRAAGVQTAHMSSVWERRPRLKAQLWLGLAAFVVLFGIGQYYFSWLWGVLRVVAYLALFGGVGWLAWRLVGEYQSTAAEVEAAIREFKLTRDATVEEGSGGYPCTELLQRYRGLVDGHGVCLLKVMTGGGRTMKLGWMIATEIYPPRFQQKFRLTVQRYPSPPSRRLHPKLTELAIAFCDQPGWVESWIDSLPETALTILNAQLAREPAVAVTDREIYRFIGLVEGTQAEKIGPAFRDLVGLAQSLGKSAEETNAFSIHTSFHYVRYQEGKESFDLTIDPGMKGAWVYVPTAKNWPQQVPEWAAGRRDEILARLRAHLDRAFEFVDS